MFQNIAFAMIVLFALTQALPQNSFLPETNNPRGNPIKEIFSSKNEFLGSRYSTLERINAVVISDIK